MKLIKTAAESEQVAQKHPGYGLKVFLVPAFTGLGAPYWDMYSRGTIVGMTRGTNRAHIVRAALEAICHTKAMILYSAMVADRGNHAPKQLKCGQRRQRQWVYDDAVSGGYPRAASGAPGGDGNHGVRRCVAGGDWRGRHKTKEEAAAMVKPDLIFTPRMAQQDETAVWLASGGRAQQGLDRKIK